MSQSKKWAKPVSKPWQIVILFLGVQLFCFFTEEDMQVFFIFLGLSGSAQMALISAPRVEYAHWVVAPISYNSKFWRIIKSYFSDTPLIQFTALFWLNSFSFYEVIAFFFSYAFMFFLVGIIPIQARRKNAKSKMIYMFVIAIIFNIPLGLADLFKWAGVETEKSIRHFNERVAWYESNIEWIAIFFGIATCVSLLIAYFAHRRIILQSPFLNPDSADDFMFNRS